MTRIVNRLRAARASWSWPRRSRPDEPDRPSGWSPPATASFGPTGAPGKVSEEPSQPVEELADDDAPIAEVGDGTASNADEESATGEDVETDDADVEVGPDADADADADMADVAVAEPPILPVIEVEPVPAIGADVEYESIDAALAAEEPETEIDEPVEKTAEEFESVDDVLAGFESVVEPEPDDDLTDGVDAPGEELDADAWLAELDGEQADPVEEQANSGSDEEPVVEGLVTDDADADDEAEDGDEAPSTDDAELIAEDDGDNESEEPKAPRPFVISTLAVAVPTEQADGDPEELVADIEPDGAADVEIEAEADSSDGPTVTVEPDATAEAEFEVTDEEEQLVDDAAPEADEPVHEDEPVLEVLDVDDLSDEDLDTEDVSEDEADDVVRSFGAFNGQNGQDDEVEVDEAVEAGADAEFDIAEFDQATDVEDEDGVVIDLDRVDQNEAVQDEAGQDEAGQDEAEFADAADEIIDLTEPETITGWNGAGDSNGAAELEEPEALDRNLGSDDDVETEADESAEPEAEEPVRFSIPSPPVIRIPPPPPSFHDQAPAIEAASEAESDVDSELDPESDADLDDEATIEPTPVEAVVTADEAATLPTMEQLRTMSAELDDIDAMLERLDEEGVAELFEPDEPSLPLPPGPA